MTPKWAVRHQKTSAGKVWLGSRCLQGEEEGKKILRVSQETL